MNNKDLESYKKVRKELWWNMMIEKHGSREAVREQMRQTRSLVKTPGLANSSKETIQKVNKASAEARRAES